MIKGSLKSIIVGIIMIALFALCWRALGVAQAMVAAKPTQVIEVGPTLLEQVRQVNKQIFVEHYLAAEISYMETYAVLNQPLSALGIKNEYLIILRGLVPAGIDLSQMSSADIWVSADGQRAQVTLPAPQIFEENVSVDLANSRIITQAAACPGFLCPAGQLAAYQRSIEPVGRARLIAVAEEAGIKAQVAIEAQSYYEQLLNALGIAEVRVVIPGYTTGQR
jgi:hypothetical protein